VRLAAERDVPRQGNGGLTATANGGPAQGSERLVLEVADDGAGFDPAGLSSSQGLGLAGIREQAELLGGGFDIRSAVGSGTRLRAWWPVHSEEEGE
jgi:glucose-6-phosphate-specific signal transduction histidine kinase